VSETCEMCGGTGIIITCCDDMCNGIGHCIHGDGEEVCPECGGEGDICDEDETRGQGDEILDITVDDAWLCICGHYEETPMHCSACGREPPWGCDCSLCHEKYEDEED